MKNNEYRPNRSMRVSLPHFRTGTARLCTPIPNPQSLIPVFKPIARVGLNRNSYTFVDQKLRIDSRPGRERTLSMVQDTADRGAPHRSIPFSRNPLADKLFQDFEPLAPSPSPDLPQRIRFAVRRPKVSIVGFVCRHSREHAIEFAAPAHDALVDGCTLLDNEPRWRTLQRLPRRPCPEDRQRHNGRHGIWFRKGRHAVVVACTLLENRPHNISLENTPGTIVFNNILAACREAIHVSSSSLETLRSDHNLFDGEFIAAIPGTDVLATRNAGTLPDWREISGQDRHSLNAEPLLVAPARTTSRRRFRRVAWPRPHYAPVCAPQRLPVWMLRQPARPPSAHLAPTNRQSRTASHESPVDMPGDGSLSVVIYDRNGQIVRTLLSGYPRPARSTSTGTGATISASPCRRAPIAGRPSTTTAARRGRRLRRQQWQTTLW